MGALNGLGTFTLNLRFPGQYFDNESGLHYNYFRDYDSSLGRYVQPDPLGLDGGSVSLYSYVNGDPVSKIDPLGFTSVVEVSGLSRLGNQVSGNAFPTRACRIVGV